MSTMKEAMTKAGFNSIEAALLKALATYLGAGGTVARLNELVAQATARMSGEGHSNCASAGHSVSAPTRQPLREREGQFLRADKAKQAVPTPREPHRAQAGHLDIAVKALARVPAAREPSKTDVAAAATARLAASRSIWDKTIGGEITLRGSTRHHWQTIVRKGHVMAHVGQRMLTEIDWPDDVTPLEKIATEADVKRIVESGYVALESLTHA